MSCASDLRGPADSVRLWYSSNLGKLCGSDAGVQPRLSQLDATRDRLLARVQDRSWRTRGLCLAPSLQLQAYGAAATLRLARNPAASAAPAPAAPAPAQGDMSRSKATALSLFDHRAPLAACLARPHAALAAARNGELERQAREEAARERQRAALAEEAEALFRLRRPDRDRHGRPVLLPPPGARTAREVFSGRDPRQVDCSLLRRGACRDNAVALLAARARRAQLTRAGPPAAGGGLAGGPTGPSDSDAPTDPGPSAAAASEPSESPVHSES